MPINAETKSAHKHKTFLIENGSIAFQDRRHEAYRHCPRQAVKDLSKTKDEVLHDGQLGCKVCYARKQVLVLLAASLLTYPEGFLKEAKAYHCFKCSFDSCDLCYDAGITSHPHAMISYVLSRPTPPEDLWTKVVLGKQNRWCDNCKGRPLLSRSAEVVLS